MDSEGRIKVGEKDVTEMFACLVCKELPKATVYQCANGHQLCHECYPRLETCAGCRCRLAPLSNPIRSLLGQSFLDEVVVVECPFKESGCEEKMYRNMAEGHAAECCYNFQKFGNFVNLCKKMGYPTCNFEFNNGNATEAIDHFVSEHDAHLTTLEKFEIRLSSFRGAIKLKNSSHFWTPVIVKLQDTSGHVLLAPAHIQKGFTYLSVKLPDPSSYGTLIQNTKLKYTAPQRRRSQSCSLFFEQNAMSIAEASDVSLENFPRLLEGRFLKAHMRTERNMQMICEIQGTSTTTAGELGAFYCKISPPLERSPSKERLKAIKWVEEEEIKCKVDREKLWEFIRRLFDTNTRPEGCKKQTLPYIKYLAYRLVLSQGTAPQLSFLKENGCNFDLYFVNTGANSFHYLLRTETNNEIGLEKIRVLVNTGEDFKRLTKSKQSPLHLAAYYSNERTVKYFVEELNLDANARDIDGWTSLHYCAVRNDDEENALKIVQVLLNNGADPEVKTKKGNGLLELAKSNYRGKLEEILRLHRNKRFKK